MSSIIRKMTWEHDPKHHFHQPVKPKTNMNTVLRRSWSVFWPSSHLKHSRRSCRLIRFFQKFVHQNAELQHKKEQTPRRTLNECMTANTGNKLWSVRTNRVGQKCRKRKTNHPSSQRASVTSFTLCVLTYQKSDPTKEQTQQHHHPTKTTSN